jgi:glycosyltransferase involved in cell wall biosynthesis
MKKILFLSKRFPQGKDLLNCPYGRFYHLPKWLSEQNLSCRVHLLSYKRITNQKNTWNNIEVLSCDALTNPLSYVQETIDYIKKEKPDWIVGFSDTYFGILAASLGKLFGIKIWIDAYDNYESYILWAKPLHWAWRSALTEANLLTAAGPQLLALLAQSNQQAKKLVIPMAADPHFLPTDKKTAKQYFDFNSHQPVIGFCGSLIASRNPQLLLQTFAKIKQLRSEVQLIISGKTDLDPPQGVHSLGYLPEKDMPILMNSLDLLLVPAGDNAFGQYAYPIKIYEALACHTAVVACDLPPIRWILQSDDCLSPANSTVMAEKAIHMLDKIILPKAVSWQSQCENAALLQALL